MKELREPFTTFMASTRHHDMDNDPHFVPMLSTDSTEIDRLHKLPRGTKIREYQRRGAAVLSEMTKLILIDGNPANIQYVEDYGTPAAINALGYINQGANEAMNRQVGMPITFDPLTGMQISPEAMKSEALAAVDLSELATANLLRGHTINHMPRYKVREAAQDIGSGALWLANLTLLDDYPNLNAYDSQYRVRVNSLNAFEHSKKIGKVIHMVPSLAALSDIDSVYSAHIRRNAPTKQARSAIAQAQEAYALAA